MGVLGGAQTAQLLAIVAAGSDGALQEQARKSLARLNGRDVDGMIVILMQSHSGPRVRAELARSLGLRGATTAVSALLAAARVPETDMRVAAIESLGRTAGEEDLPALIRLLSESKRTTERADLEEVLVAAARRAPIAEHRTACIVQALSRETDPQVKSSLMMVLSHLCGREALESVTVALTDSNQEIRDAAVRSLAAWEHPEATDVLLRVSKAATDANLQTLALANHVRLLARQTDRSNEERLDRYKAALQLATEDSVRNQILLGIGAIRSMEALQFVLGYLDEPALQEQAASAASRIAGHLTDLHPEVVRDAMVKVLAVAKDEQTRRAARHVTTPEAREGRAMRRQMRREASSDR